MALQQAHVTESFAEPNGEAMAFRASDGRDVHRILNYFHSLGQMSREMNPSTQIARTLESTVETMVDAFGLDRAVLLAAHDADGRLRPVAGYGVPLHTAQPVEMTAAVRQRLIRKPHLTPLHSLPGELADWLGDSPGAPPDMADHHAAVPLVTSGELVGLFVFEQVSEWTALTHPDGDLLCGMCQNLAVYLYNQIVLARLTDKRRELDALAASIKEIYRQAVMAFLTAIDIKDGYTKEHSHRVAEMAAVLAQEMRFSDHEVEGMYFAGLLHDIGKILVDREILTKSGALDLTEFAAMNAHTHLGAEILSHIEFPWENLTYAILHHHDRPAYDEFAPPKPRRNLDLSHKIIALVDAFDAMTSNRPYRRALPFRECLHELVKGLSVQFDPETTRGFLQAMLRDLERPPVQRRLLTDRLVRGDVEKLREKISDTLFQVEQYMGVITGY